MSNTLRRRGLLAWAGMSAVTGAGAQAAETPQLIRVPLDVSLGKTLDGQPVTLADFGGLPTLVVFWAAWCPQCRNELPMIEQIQAAAGKERMRVIAINVEEKAVFRKMHRALSESSQMVLTYDPDQASTKAFGRPESVPWTFVLRGDGTVAGRQGGWGAGSLEYLAERLNAVLAEAKKTPG